MTAAMAMVVIGNAEIVEDGEYVQPLEVGQVIQAECKPPLAVSNLLELGVCNRDDNILGIEEGW